MAKTCCSVPYLGHTRGCSSWLDRNQKTSKWSHKLCTPKHTCRWRAANMIIHTPSFSSITQYLCNILEIDLIVQNRVLQPNECVWNNFRIAKLRAKQPVKMARVRSDKSSMGSEWRVKKHSIWVVNRTIKKNFLSHHVTVSILFISDNKILCFIRDSLNISDWDHRYQIYRFLEYPFKQQLHDQQ